MVVRSSGSTQIWIGCKTLKATRAGLISNIAASDDGAENTEEGGKAPLAEIAAAASPKLHHSEGHDPRECAGVHVYAVNYRRNVATTGIPSPRTFDRHW